MEAHVAALLKATGWKAGDVAYENRSLRHSDGEGRDAPGSSGPPMSSASFTTDAAVIDRASGTLPVGPFARAFRDLSLLYVTFFVPGEFAFQGLRRHSDADLDVALNEADGAYTYVVSVKNPRMEAPNLPRFQAVPPDGTPRRAAPHRGTPAGGPAAAPGWRFALATCLVVMLAAGAGLFVYSWTRRLSGR
jgi:hypothetical protein